MINVQKDNLFLLIKSLPKSEKNDIITRQKRLEWCVYTAKEAIIPSCSKSVNSLKLCGCPIFT